MKFFLIKIIFGICILISLNACHTFEHQNIFNQNIKKSLNEKLLDKKPSENNKIIPIDIPKQKEIAPIDLLKQTEMAPIDLPKQTEIIQKITLKKQVKIPNANDFSLDKFLNWNEAKIIKTLGISHFIKEEGKLKNYQYHFKECYIDIFLLKKHQLYLVNYVEMRPTKLNGTINIKACFDEINQLLN